MPITQGVSQDSVGSEIVKDVLTSGGQYRVQSITATAAEALGAATILTNRKMLSVTPTTGTVYWGLDSSVTAANGTPIFKNQSMQFSVGTGTHIYLIAPVTTDVRIAELA